jgi:hypothetical protein
MGKGIRVVFPKLKSFGAFGVGCMHSKLQLLFHVDHLRVVVPTVLIEKCSTDIRAISSPMTGEKQASWRM